MSYSDLERQSMQRFAARADLDAANCTIEAACRFVEVAGGYAGIGCLQNAAAILAGQAGAMIEASS